MNKYIMIVLNSAIWMSTVHATTGTINFSGRVSESTCQVSNSGGPNLTVLLPNIPATQLSSVGAVAGKTPFKIVMSGCRSSQVAAFFETLGNVNHATGHLINNAADGAKNINIQILNSNSQKILLNSIGLDKIQPNSEWVIPNSGDGNAEINYFAEYYATGQVTSGEVRSSLQYTLVYR